MSQLDLLLLHVQPQASSRIQFGSSTDRQQGLLTEYLHFSCLFTFSLFIMRTTHILCGKMRLFSKICFEIKQVCSFRSDELEHNC